MMETSFKLQSWGTTYKYLLSWHFVYKMEVKKLRALRVSKVTATIISVCFLMTACCYGKFPYSISIEHTQQKTFFFFNFCFQALEVTVGIRFDAN